MGDTAGSVVLLPGFDGTGELYAPLEEHLAAPTVRVAYGVPKNPEAYLTTAEEQIPDDHGVVLVAESFSGPIALELLMRGKRDYRALVLSATFARVPHASVLATVVNNGLQGLGTTMVRKLISDGLGLGFKGRAGVREEVLRVIGSMKPAVIRSRLAALLHFDLSRSLNKVSVPTTVLSPTMDRLVPNGESLRLATAIRHAKLVRIPGPHFLLQVAPQRCAKEIMAVFES